MRLLLDILQGAGLSAAAGIRPFLPALAAGGLASADLGIDFDGTRFEFLERPAFLVVLLVALVASVVLRARLRAPAATAALSGIGIGLGALLFAGTLDDRHDTWWPGLVGGLACAALAGAAVRDLLGRTSARLDTEAAGALGFYAEAVAMALAGGAILFPPLSVLALGFLVWLLAGGRRRSGEKYAGLRILR